MEPDELNDKIEEAIFPEDEEEMKVETEPEEPEEDTGED